MSEFLLTLFDVGGDVPPTLSVAVALRDRGHGVRAIGDPCLAQEVRAAGIEFVPWTTAPRRTDRGRDGDLVRDWELKSGAKSFSRARDAVTIGPAGRYAADVLAELARRPADVVVSPPMVAGSLIAAEASSARSAVLLPTVNVLGAPGIPPTGRGFLPARGPLGRLRDRVVAGIAERMWDSGLETLNAARAGVGLAPLRHVVDQIHRADRILVATTRAFDFPSPQLPPSFRYVGPRLMDPTWAADWSAPEGEGPLILASLSSTFMDQGPLLDRIAAGLGTLPVRGLITTGPAFAPGDVAAPPNVTVLESAPHGRVMPAAGAVVTHGGHGTVIKALAHGIPVVCLPMGRDQHDVAARVQVAGAGLRLPADASPQRIAQAVRRVLQDPGIHAAAQRIGAAIRSDLVRDRAVEELEQLADAGTTASADLALALEASLAGAR
ncbi:glycosyltransferase [Patulibacter defluvii]|uniref:glycosyltransferase n=1 Tax=Patulibacter defluvii TaxID=3095358 RepID=UPI002A74BA96|nr:glycosyltransferase [Patulibacter sp. DM4]